MSSERKNIIQDIISAKKPQIRTREPNQDAAPSPHSYGTTPRKSSNSWGKRALGLLIIAGIGYYGISLFSSITVKVTPRSAALSIDRNYMAEQNPDPSLTDVGSYELMKILKTASRSIPTTGEEKISQKASGKIIVYNKASETPQKLIKNTRFESKEGKIYRIAQAITVPGKTASGPGSIETTVTADEAGSASNVGMTEFTIPGLKGSPRFETMWAVSKTDIAGGFEGIRKSASLAAIKEAETAIKAETSLALDGELAKQVPEGFILFPEATAMGFALKEGDAAPDDGDTYTVEGTATAYGIIFNRADLSRLIATRELSDYDGNPVLVENMDELRFTFFNKENFVPEQGGKIVFSLQGPARIVWQFDQEKLKNDLAGLSKRQYEGVFLAYPAIQRAESVFKPSWRQSFPDDPTKIAVERVLE